MTKKELWAIFEEMIELLGERRLLDELFDALSSDQLKENLEYISDNYDMSDLWLR